MNKAETYVPDFVFPPGGTLRELLEERSMSRSELAERMGQPRKVIDDIIGGEASVTAEIALQLEATLGVPAAVWNDLQTARDVFSQRNLGDRKVPCAPHR